MVGASKNYIGGRWASSASKKTFFSLNPATGKALASFQLSTEADVDAAVNAAEAALPAWSATPAPKRALMLLKIANLLRNDKERLARIVTVEMGKVLKEARGDVQEAIDTFEYFAGEGRRLLGNTAPSELREKFAMTVRRPVGVFGLITPWNFPIAIPAWKIAPALVCGNSVIFKPSSDSPLCATELVKIIEKSGVPRGVVNMVTGPADGVGSSIVKDSRIRGISFTGSRETGEWIMRNAGIKKIGMELGGKNAIIVMDDADIGLALDGAIWGAFGTAGQRCTAASRLLVHEKIATKFTAALVDRARRLRAGNGLLASTDVGPLVNKAAVEKTKRYVDIGVAEGAKLLCGGKALPGRGFFFQPTIFSAEPGMRISQEEIFGPVASLITVNGLEEAISVANGTGYGLSSSIYTRDVSSAFKAIEGIEAGITYINASTIGAEVHLPFGGVKGTGIGTREAGIEGIDEFSEIKTVYVDYSGKLQKAQMD